MAVLKYYTCIKMKSKFVSACDCRMFSIKRCQLTLHKMFEVFLSVKKHILCT